MRLLLLSMPAVDAAVAARCHARRGARLRPAGRSARLLRGLRQVRAQAVDVTRVVAVDGPSGSGKSTVARGVARALGWRYVDTGATYRAATLAVLRAGVPLDDPEAVAAAVDQALGHDGLQLGTDPDRPGVLLGGGDVSVEIRGPEVTQAVSAVSAVPAVRRRLVALQQAVIGAGDAVVEGRDICQVVAPAAAVKVYLDADQAVRAARRARDVDSGVAVSAGSGPSVTAVAADLARRDALDSSRAADPLSRSDEAVHLDATHLSAEQVVEAVLALVDAAGLRDG
jgi:CMP/dCMP kinase